jgi:hypothetical protein
MGKLVCNANITSIGDVICKIGSILNSVIPILIALGVVYFIWGVINYVISDGEEAKKKGKNQMIYGIIGLVVITGLWGLVSVVINTFGFSQGSNIASSFIQSNNSILPSSVASGATCNLPSSPKLADLLNYSTCILIKSVVPLILALAVIMFIWGVVQYVINDQEEAKREKGKQFMIWGIIGLTVMIGIWGLVSILGSTFGITYAIPQLPVTATQ